MRFAVAALIFACSISPVLAVAKKFPKEPLGPSCTLAPEVIAILKKDDPAAMIIQLDGNDAVAMIKAINETGNLTYYKAKTLVVRIFEDHVAVVLFNPCATGIIKMSFDTFSKAIEKSRDNGI